MRHEKKEVMMADEREAVAIKRYIHQEEVEDDKGNRVKDVIGT